MSWQRWGGWALAGALLLTSALLYAEHREAVGEARQADRVAAEYRAEAETARERAERARDSLRASRERERAYRARLDSALEALAADAEAAGEQVEVQTAGLDSTLAEIARRVPDELVGLVTRAMRQADSVSRAHVRYRQAMERRVALMADRERSVRRQLGRTDATLSAVEVELASVRAELVATREARDRWREAASPDLLGRILGRDLLSASATVASGVVAWACSPEAGAGWTVGQVARVVF